MVQISATETASARCSGSLELTVLVLHWQAFSHKLACMCIAPDLDPRPGIMDMNVSRSARALLPCDTRTVYARSASDVWGR